MANTGIPEKITLGGVEYTVKDHPELLEALQAARTEEKDKLYSKISTLEARAKTLETESKNKGQLSEAKEAELKKLQDELAVVKAEKKKLETGDDTEAAKKKAAEEAAKKKAEEGNQFTKADIQAAVKEAMAESKKEFDEELAKIKKDVSGVGGKVTEKEIADHREKLLAKYDGVIINKFVPTGLKSIEDVDKAISEALVDSKPYIRKEYDIDGKKQSMSIAEYEEYAEKKKAEEEAGKGGNGGTPDYQGADPARKPGNTGGDLTGKQLLKDVENMSDEEYAKHHKEILREARTMKYGDTEE